MLRIDAHGQKRNATRISTQQPVCVVELARNYWANVGAAGIQKGEHDHFAAVLGEVYRLAKLIFELKGRSYFCRGELGPVEWVRARTRSQADDQQEYCIDYVDYSLSTLR